MYGTLLLNQVTSLLVSGIGCLSGIVLTLTISTDSFRISNWSHLRKTAQWTKYYVTQHTVLAETSCKILTANDNMHLKHVRSILQLNRTSVLYHTVTEIW